MADFLEPDYLSNSSRTNTEMKAAFEQLNAAGKSLLGATAPVAVTISGDSIEVTGPIMIVDTQDGAASDDLRTISIEDIRSGYCVLLWAASTERAITLKHSPATLGGLSLSSGEDYILTPSKPAMFALVGTSWKEVLTLGTTGDSGAVEHGREEFIANGTFTVPAGVTKVYLTGAGGGGGGGGGGRSGAPGGGVQAASSGGMTKFNNFMICAAGLAGEIGLDYGRGGKGGNYGGNPGRDAFRQSTVGAEGGEGAWTPIRGLNNMYPYGMGGKGGLGAVDLAQNHWPGGGGGGGGAYYVSRMPYTVTPGASIAVVVGGGGVGGGGMKGSGGDGGAGSNGIGGILIVEW